MPVSRVFHLFRAPTQLAPATSVGTIPKGRVSPYVTFDFAVLAREKRGGLPACPWSAAKGLATEAPTVSASHCVTVFAFPLDPFFHLFRAPPQTMLKPRLTVAPASFFRLLSPWFCGESRPPESAERGKKMRQSKCLTRPAARAAFQPQQCQGGCPDRWCRAR